MAERKTGPVKPPTIDLTARSADKPAPDAGKTDKDTTMSAATRSDKPRSERVSTAGKAEAHGPHKAKPDLASAADKPETSDAAQKAKPSGKSNGVLPLVLTGVAGTVFGGILGLAGAYGLATLGYWPSGTDATRIAALSDEVKSLYVKKSELGAVVDRAVGDVTSELAALGDRVGTLEANAPADPTPALDALTPRVATLETGLAALGKKLDTAVIGGGDPAAEEALGSLTSRLDGISTETDQLSAKLAALEAAKTVAPETVTALDTVLQTLERKVETLSSGVEALQSAPAPKPVDLRLPLALSGLSDALETGAGFSRELALIRAALPDLAIPDIVAAAAVSGLGNPSDLEARFTALLPGILAAKPADDRASWTDRLVDKFKALVALRPVAGSADTSPEALVSRIEAALGARDYAAAAKAFAALPQPMRQAAGGIDGTVDAFAAASDLVARAREAALVLAGAQS